MKVRAGNCAVCVQMPQELWEALRAEAKREDRSATAQLIHILRERYRARKKDRQK